MHRIRRDACERCVQRRPCARFLDSTYCCFCQTYYCCFIGTTGWTGTRHDEAVLLNAMLLVLKKYIRLQGKQANSKKVGIACFVSFRWIWLARFRCFCTLVNILVPYIQLRKCLVLLKDNVVAKSLLQKLDLALLESLFHPWERERKITCTLSILTFLGITCLSVFQQPLTVGSSWLREMMKVKRPLLQALIFCHKGACLAVSWCRWQTAFTSWFE